MLLICMSCVMRMDSSCRVASTSRLLKIIGLFCKRALQTRRYSAKETHNCKEPTNRSHPLHHMSMRIISHVSVNHRELFRISILIISHVIVNHRYDSHVNVNHCCHISRINVNHFRCECEYRGFTCQITTIHMPM